MLEPLQQIEVVAGELVNGNLHSNLEYHSDDEVGKLAHDLRSLSGHLAHILMISTRL